MNVTHTLLALVFPAVLSAQWFSVPTPGVHRLSDGTPNLSATAPKAADGKPDLSGIWRADPTEDGFRYARNIAADLQPDEVTSWAEAVARQRTENFQRDQPWARCQPLGMPLNETTSIPYRIV